MLHILQKTCANACSNCPSRKAQRTDHSSDQTSDHFCSRKADCAIQCPPLIVLAVIEAAHRALAAATLPAFGSMRSATV